VDHESDLPSSADFARIEDKLFTRINQRYRRQVLRHRLVAVAAVLVVAGAGVAAGTIATPSQQERFAYCYGGSTTSSHSVQLALTYQSKAGSDPTAGASKKREAGALLLCRSAWKGGVLNTTSSTGPFAVPPLQVCVRDDLALAVFRKPSGDINATTFCENLGLSAP
jgi:hypothetical protein